MSTRSEVGALPRAPLFPVVAVVAAAGLLMLAVVLGLAARQGEGTASEARGPNVAAVAKQFPAGATIEWRTAAFTGRLGGVTPQVDWSAAAREAGFTGRVGAVTQDATSRVVARYAALGALEEPTSSVVARYEALGALDHPYRRRGG